MNILFDQTEAQAPFWNGAAEYAQSVFFKLLSLVKNTDDVNLFCLYSSEKSFRYEQLSPEQVDGVTYVDYHKTSLKDIIKENRIDILFVSCAQYFCDLPIGNLEHLGCKTVVVIHDLLDEEMNNSGIELFKYLRQPMVLTRFLAGKLITRIRSGQFSGRMHAVQKLLLTNNATIVTVSEYTKSSIKYNYPSLRNDIRVYAAPEKRVNMTDEVNNAELKKLIASGKQYFLLLSANRVLKNAHSMLKAFHVYKKTVNPNAVIVTVGAKKQEFEEHLSLPFLSPSDLEHAYKNCHVLLYPSLFEGFGYPPLEAMKYAKPVLSSNVCSMPEVLGKSPIYFSPLYESDMYRALTEFWRFDYSTLCERAYLQYEKVVKLQTQDLERLANDLITGNF